MKIHNFVSSKMLALVLARFVKCQSVRLILMPLFAIMLFPTTSSAQSNDTVTNKTIVDLSKAGISKTIISAKINASLCYFDLSTDGLISLKKNGVSDDIINVMITKGNSAPPPPVQDNNNNQPVQNNTPDANSQSGGETALRPGIYYFNSKTNDYAEIDEALTNNKSGGFGNAMLRASVSSLINTKVTETINGKEANLKIQSAKPLFVFVIDIPNYQTGPMIKSPNEIFLVKLKETKKSRELVVGKANSVGSNVGVDDKVKLSFTYNKVQSGLYEITPNDPLPTGEYGFIYAGQAGADGSNSYKLYDFSIR